ncbi:hypothetical protein [Helicobacter mesocricetorum]|uniref:hypothetical protein n=1 Tax=Helicobacter mesocricetorum TaxID=87012 RepID=UPI001F43352A|nr:hypothetical protein [Helicobacter mesocricetorum]
MKKDFAKLFNLAIKIVWLWIYTSLLLFLLAFLAGCSTKPILKVQTKEVFIPIKCNLKLPPKPKENGSFESHKELSLYYKEVEQIAKDCTRRD